MNKRKINFAKELGLNHQLMGYIARVTGPKAKREVCNVDGKEIYHYELNSEVVGTGIDPEISVEPGLYEILDICRWNGKDSKMQWNIYLAEVTKDDFIPVAEYLDNPFTEWVKDAKNIVKAFFNDEELDRIDLTPQPKPKEVTGWGTSRNTASKPTKGEDNFMNKPESSGEDTNKSETSKKSTKETTASSTEIPYGFAIVYRKNGNRLKKAKINRFSSKYVEIDLDGKPTKYLRETGACVEGSTHIEFNLTKEE
jgi:hypothetical protein